jgi:hypothetical protein
MPSVLVDYSFACDAYCTARWGEPSTEVKGATCPRCAARKVVHRANKERAYKNHLKNTYDKHGKGQTERRKQREKLAIEERKEEERLYGHLLTAKE